MINIRRYNQKAWDKQAENGNPWTIPVYPKEIAAAHIGRWSIRLTPLRPMPPDWFPPLPGARVLCLASGAEVTVLDNSPRQLEQDREVADREDLRLQTVEDVDAL
jgi:hypothetical protein